MKSAFLYLIATWSIPEARCIYLYLIRYFTNNFGSIIDHYCLFSSLYDELIRSKEIVN